MRSIQSTPLQAIRGAIRVSIVVAALLVSACGIIDNRKPIPAGTPTAHVHVGPVTGGFRSVSLSVRDGEHCHPAQFKKGGVTGTYLGSDIDLEVPADRKLFFIMADNEGRGTTVVQCGGTVAFAPEPGAKYTVNLIHPGKQCGIVVQKDSNGGKVPVATEVVPGTCLY